ncbi:MAG: sulfatase-like hydrolase/transferase, partial [Candidatus Omnitrophica bacterium]|nr:sulfatase-like hydrolase/transferase [Candidatus Omnitrophota bacterium]
MALVRMAYKCRLFIIFVLSVITLPNFTYSQDNESPNVILIIVDSLRPDHLGCYGYERNTSPCIDKLAKESVVFTQAISQGPATIPSVPSLFTSNYFNSGDWVNNMSGIRKVKFVIPTLQEILKTKGYSTVYICSSPLLSELKCLQQGWDKM